MDENESQEVETEAEETEPDFLEETEESSEEESEEDTTEDESEKPKKRKEETPQQKKSRLERELKRLHKQNPDLDEKPASEKKTKTKTDDGLSDAVLDYFELKGITEQEDIDLIQSVMEKTGKSHRDVLKDDYVVSKLDSNQKTRDVKSATPSGSKRAGQGGNDNVDFWFAKYSQNWELPKGMPKGMNEKLVERRYIAESPTNNPFD